LTFKIKSTKLHKSVEFRIKTFKESLKNSIIKKAFRNEYSADGYLKYTYYSKNDMGDYREYHIYSLFNCNFINPVFSPIIELQYITVSRKKGSKYDFLYAEINLIKKHEKGLKRFTFIQKPYKSIRLTSKRLEFVLCYLHSADKPASSSHFPLRLINGLRKLPD